jgi:hypothetical protein
MYGRDAVDRTFAEINAMISSVVIYLDAHGAGSGFYRLAVQMGLLTPQPSPYARDAFWSSQVRAVHNHFSQCR